MAKKAAQDIDLTIQPEENVQEVKPEKKTTRKRAPKKEAPVEVAKSEEPKVEEAPKKKTAKKSTGKKSAKKDETAVADAKAEEPKVEEAPKKKTAKESTGKKSAKKDETAVAEVKAEEPKVEEAPKKKTAKKSTGKKSAKKDETAVAEVKAEESKVEEAPKKKTAKKSTGKKSAKKDETAVAEVKAEVPKVEEAPKKKPAKKSTGKKSAKKDETAVAEVKAEEPKVEEAPKKKTAKKSTGKKSAKKTTNKKSAEKTESTLVFDRDAIFAEVFGLNKPVTKEETKPEKKAARKKPAKKSEPVKAAEPVAEIKPETVEEPKKKVYDKILPYGKISGRKAPEKKTEAPKKADTKPSFFGFGKLSAEDIAKMKSDKKADSKKPETEAKPKKKKSTEKADKKQKTTPEKKPFNRDEIFARVFGYEIKKSEPKQNPEKKAEQPKKAEPKAENKPAEKLTPAPKKKRKTSLFKMFSNKGKKKRDNFTAPQKPKKKTPVFNRDEIFARVFGYEIKKADTIKSKPEQPKKSEPQKKSAPKKQNNTRSADKELEQLIRASYTGNYPRSAMTKPLTDSEKRWATSFESFFRSRGFNLEFSESGATKTGIVTARIIESGSMVNVLDFFNKTKSEISKLICGGEDAYRKFVEGDKPFYVVFDASKRKIIEAARGFGIITNVKENSDGTLNVQFSKLPKVIDYFRGGFLESYAYYIAKDVAKKVADKHKLSFEVATNAIITDNNGKMIHEYDTMLKLGNIVFILEEKSSRYFSDFDKFANDMDQLKFNKKNYMILLMNKNSEEMEAIEWFFDLRVANLSTYAGKLEEMLTEAIEELSI